MSSEVKTTKKKQDQTSESTSRVRWTPELHETFLKAISELERSQKTVSPIAIMKLMNNWSQKKNSPTAKLTRVHIASHLQKYRSDLKCRQYARLGYGTPPTLYNNKTSKAKVQEPESPEETSASPSYSASPSPVAEIQHSQPSVMSLEEVEQCNNAGTFRFEHLHNPNVYESLDYGGYQPQSPIPIYTYINNTSSPSSGVLGCWPTYQFCCTTCGKPAL